MNATARPASLTAVADLQRCLHARDYAGAARLIRRQAVADGLDALAGPAWQSAAEAAYRESVQAWRDDREAAARERLERDVGVLVAVLAEMAGAAGMAVPDRVKTAA